MLPTPAVKVMVVTAGMFAAHCPAIPETHVPVPPDSVIVPTKSVENNNVSCVIRPGMVVLPAVIGVAPDPPMPKSLAGNDAHNSSARIVDVINLVIGFIVCEFALLGFEKRFLAVKLPLVSRP